MNIGLAINSLTNLKAHICREPKHFDAVKNSIAKLISALDSTDLSATFTGNETYSVDDMDWSHDHTQCSAATDCLNEIIHQLSQSQRATLFTALSLDIDDASQHPITEAFVELTGDIVRCAAPWYQHGHNLSIYGIE